MASKTLVRALNCPSIKTKVVTLPAKFSTLSTGKKPDIELFDKLKLQKPEDIVEWAVKSGDVAMMSSFGTQAAVLLHLASQTQPDIPVIMIDTGYLLPETYTYAEELKQLLGLNLHVVSPAMTSARMEATHGKLWESDDDASHKLYGKITKTEPMGRALESLPVKPGLMLSGLRASQTEARKDMKHVSMQSNGSLKVLPMLNMSDRDVEDYMAHHRLPQHPLALKGYVTVGDWHSSRPLAEGETAADARKTRFGGKFEECGLHIDATEEVQEPEDVRDFSKAHLKMTPRPKALKILETTKQVPESTVLTHFVKKQNEDGEWCRKCLDVAAMLKKDDLERLIGGVSVANVNNKDSDGAVLSQHFKQKLAPFFLVKNVGAQNAEWAPIYAYGKWKKLMNSSKVASTAE